MNVIHDAKEVLTFKEACEYTGYSKAYMYKLTSNREIPHFKPSGKLIFFNRNELIGWLQSNRVDTSAALAYKAHGMASKV